MSKIAEEKAKEIVLASVKRIVKVEDAENWLQHNLTAYQLAMDVALNAYYQEKEDEAKKQQFKAFDKVLVRDNDNDIWYCAHFSHYYDGEDHDDSYRYKTTRGLGYKQCIPFNSKTKHLLGTKDNPKCSCLS